MDTIIFDKGIDRSDHTGEIERVCYTSENGIATDEELSERFADYRDGIMQRFLRKE